MEHSKGKRVMPDPEGGRRRKSGRPPKVLVGVLIFLLLLCAGYAGMCAYAATSGKLLPNARISGVQVGSLTREEAQARRGELASLLLPVGTAFAHRPALSLSAHFARLFTNGVRLRAEQVGSPQPGEYRVFGPDGFLGVALQDGGQLRIKRLFLGGG